MMEYVTSSFFGRDFFPFLRPILIPVDPAGDRCYGGSLSHASQGALLSTGERLSNTSIICPLIRDNHGKLWLILDRERILEGSFLQSFCVKG